MVAKVFSSQVNGVLADIVFVEADVSSGLPSFSIIGLPDKAVEESKDRVCSSLKHIGIVSPSKKTEKVIISLAPADKKKEGSHFDLPIAISYIIATKQIDFDIDKKMFLGELSLDASVYPVKGVLPSVIKAKNYGIKEVFVPDGNALEAALVEGITIYPVKNLNDIILHFSGEKQLIPQKKTSIEAYKIDYPVLLDDIKGQEYAKRGLILAAAGGHNIAFYGPPGTGKTLLSKALTSILPPLNTEEILEVTSVYSISGKLDGGLIITNAPFRSPHHTASYTAIVGGGVPIMPGEVSLAHKGVLFLDEFPEFDRRVIESLREPLEEKVIRISRAKGSSTFPADCIVALAMNPSPLTDGRINTRAEATYRKKLSGPIIDRIDMWIYVDSVDIKELSKIKDECQDETESARKMVSEARNIQIERYKKETNIKKNSDLTSRVIDKYANLNESAREILDSSAIKIGLSPRSYHRTIKLARTIADLDNEEKILDKHILEALQYKKKI